MPSSCILCVASAALVQPARTTRQGTQKAQHPRQGGRGIAEEALEQTPRRLLQIHRRDKAALRTAPERGLRQLLPSPGLPASQGADRDRQRRGQGVRFGVLPRYDAGRPPRRSRPDRPAGPRTAPSAASGVADTAHSKSCDAWRTPRAMAPDSRGGYGGSRPDAACRRRRGNRPLGWPRRGPRRCAAARRKAWGFQVRRGTLMESLCLRKQETLPTGAVFQAPRGRPSALPHER
ncbi:hypothetical protein BDD21_5568 [Thiocapsa rosea]|uniref:Uncharacterized protein n=1 Tax=Thiocapsa rosea TaxID=69360 RepID=A0A495UNZ9_9GAMM|nr:hypothetical protein BDD21_5568 [Thiocapsa rosea]